MEKSFEECMKELEDIAAKLDSGNVSLEESLKLYEKAVELCKICKAKLDDGNGKLTVLRKTLSGIVEEDLGDK